MAFLFSNQGKYDTALEWYKRALAGKEKSLGPDHPSTLTTVHNMAFAFWEQGDYVKALQYWERSYEGRRRVLGDSHPGTQDAFNTLNTHRAQFHSLEK